MPSRPQPLAVSAKNHHELSPLAAALIKSFERHLQADGASPNTQVHYLGATRQFLQFGIENNLPELTGVRREHVELWLQALYKEYATATVRNRFVGLHVFFKWLVEEGEIRTDPMEKIKRPVLDETRKDVVPADDMATVLKYLEGKRRWRDCVLIGLFYDTGMRAGEVADCLTENVNMETRRILIPKSKNKKMRTVGLSPKVIQYIDRYWRHPRKEPLWLVNGLRGRMTNNGVYQAVRSIFEELGYEAVIGPHDLRHTAASRVVGKMTETQMMTLFGWSDPAMARHYAAQALEEDALEAHKLHSPLERLPKK